MPSIMVVEDFNGISYIFHKCITKITISKQNNRSYPRDHEIYNYVTPWSSLLEKTICKDIQ